MILYLSRNETANLLDRAASENALHIRKLSGNFCLSEFIVRDMRKFASCRYFCVERLAITESNDEFIKALQSFQIMYGARIIVIHESANGTDSLIRGLVHTGVTDIVTACGMDEKQGQIAECLSDAGMLRYKPKPIMARDYDDEPDEEEYGERETPTWSMIQKEKEDEHYCFDCVNVNIGVIGATRRVGTTTTALGLVNFIRNRGGAVCYAALNMNRHLESIAEAYGFDVEEDYYTYDAVDFYECMLPKHDYNFIVSDFGDIYNGEVRREAVKRFKGCDVHLLCGANGRLHEIMELLEALKAVRSAKPHIITYEPGAEYGELFRSSVSEKPVIVKPVKNMLDFKTNGLVFKGIVQPYIVETAKRL